MNLTNFKYYLRKYIVASTAYVYFYIDANGFKQQTFTKTSLPYAPKGWEEQELTQERGFEYWGVFTKYSNPLEFVREGADILRQIYYNEGIEGDCELLIEKLDTTVASFGYYEYYAGDLDFSRFQDKKDFVTCEIMERGFLAKMKAKEDSTLEIQVEQNPQVIWVKMDGYPLGARVTTIGLDQPRFPDGSIDSVAEANGSLSIYRKILPTTNFLYIDGYANGDIEVKANPYTGVNITPKVTNNSGTYDSTIESNYQIYNNSQVTYNVRVQGIAEIGTINQSTLNPVTLRVIAWVVNNNAVISTYTLGFSSSIGFTGSVYTVNTFEIDDTIPLAPADKLYLLVYHSDTNPANALTFTHIYKFDINFEWASTVKTSYIPALSAYVVGNELVDNIDNDSSFTSDVYNDNRDFLLTSGDALRNLPDSVLKTTFKDFIKASDCMHNTAFYYNKSTFEANINYKWAVFDNSSTLNIGEVNNIQVTPLTSEMFARVIFGYKPYTYDAINGKEEYNTQYEFQSILTRVTNLKEFISPYRADMFGIELTRANLTNKTQADNDSDNDVFWLDVDTSSVAGTVPAGVPGAGEDYYELNRPALTITGVNSPSQAYNIRLSPKRRMNEMGYLIRSIFYPQGTSVLKYNSTEKSTSGNLGLVTDDGVTIIDEKANEIINNLSLANLPAGAYTNDCIFYPLMFSVEAKIPLNISTLNSNPYIEIEFTYKGNTYYGWVVSMKDQPSFRQKQTFKLLCSSKTSLATLQYGI
jgi:hypothetical protein